MRKPQNYSFKNSIFKSLSSRSNNTKSNIKKISKIILTIALIILLNPIKTSANPDAEYGWHEFRGEDCELGPNTVCCIYAKTLWYDVDTCELSSSGEHLNSIRLGADCAYSGIPSSWDPMGGTAHYPEDSQGDPLPSVGGCNETITYYECSPKYQDTIDFNNQFTDKTEWWYFTSTGSGGNTYKCMASYKNSQGDTIHHRTSDYHSVNPVSSSDCLSEETFDALDNDMATCGQPSNAHNKGIYTTYNDPNSTYSCVDGNGDGVDDSTGVSCNVIAAKRPDGKLGNPDTFNNSAETKQKNPSFCGAPIWKVNMVNMNLYIIDTPLWYNPPIGPSVSIQLSYNSQAQITSNSLFGNKWVFNYNSYLNEDVSGNVTVFMPDGRQDVYIDDGQGSYIKPYGIFNSLTKIANNNFELEFLDGTVYIYSTQSTINPSHTLLSEIRDSYSQKIIFGYNNDQLQTITDALNKVTSLIDSDSNGLIDRIDDPFGRSAYFNYDANRNLTKITDMGSYWTEFSYDTNVYITTLKNDSGTWNFNIEPSDGTTNISNPYPAPGGSMGENYRITATDPLGNKEEYYYFGPYSWYVSPRDYVPYTDPDNNNFKSAPKTYYILTESYQTQRISKILYPEGGHEKYKYDPVIGKPITSTDFHGSGVTHNSYYTYNSNGLVMSFTDAKGNITTFEYFPNNIDIQKIKLDLVNTPGNDDIRLKTFTYNGITHDISTVTDRLGIITEFNYNSYGQMDSVTQARNTSVEMITDLVYDSVTHELNEIKKSGNIVESFTYDSISRIRTHTDATGLMLTYDYNNLNKITKITYPDIKFETFTYSTCCPHLIDSITDRAGITTNYTYDASKRLIRVQGPNGIIKYEHDANRNLKKLIDADGKETSYDYDLDNRLIKKIYADGKFIQYTYDLAGLLTKVINSRNIERIYTYDENHNLLTIDYSDTTPDVTFTYDDYDRIQTMTDGIGTYQYGYDDLNRLTNIDGPWNNDTITFQYNELGHLKTTTPQGGQTITYNYDYDTGYSDPDIGRLKDIQEGANTFTYNYTGVNPLIQSLTRPNGSITEYLYNDPLKRLTEITNKDSSQAVINKHIYTFNNLDLIDTETITTGTSIDSFTEGLKTYNYNNLNQLLNSTNPAETFIYDNDGNMTQGYTPEGYQFTATYDAVNRLTSIQYTDSGSVVHKTEYYYNGDGLLAELKEYEDSSLVNNIRFIRAGFLPIQERDGSNVVIREYTWGLNMGGGIGGLLNLRENSNDYSYLYDGKGNVMALLDSSQSVVASYRYDVFGMPLKKTGTFDQPFRFSTKRYDEQTGHYNYGYRFYNPTLGKWMTRDPLGEAGGMNLYGFVENNPINFVDPWGLWGIGISGSESTEIGNILIGAGQTGSLGVGLFGEGLRNLNIGGFASWGGFAGSPGFNKSYPPCPDNDNWILGAFGGGGANIFITNASRAPDLSGPAKTYSFNLGWGVRLLSLQFTISNNGTWIFSYGGPIPGLPVTGGGYGTSISKYNTNTWTTK